MTRRVGTRRGGVGSCAQRYEKQMGQRDRPTTLSSLLSEWSELESELLLCWGFLGSGMLEWCW